MNRLLRAYEAWIDTEKIGYPPDAALIDAIHERIREARAGARIGGAAEG